MKAENYTARDGSEQVQYLLPLPLTREEVAIPICGKLKPVKEGYSMRCPGWRKHTAPTKEGDTILTLRGTPTIHCWHHSCRAIVEGANRQLRAAITAEEGKPCSIEPLLRKRKTPATWDPRAHRIAREVFRADRQEEKYLRAGLDRNGQLIPEYFPKSTIKTGKENAE